MRSSYATVRDSRALLSIATSRENSHGSSPRKLLPTFPHGLGFDAHGAMPSPLEAPRAVRRMLSPRYSNSRNKTSSTSDIPRSQASLEARAVAEQPVSTHVEGELRSYRTCGILCFGFAKAGCTACGQADSPVGSETPRQPREARRLSKVSRGDWIRTSDLYILNVAQRARSRLPICKTRDDTRAFRYDPF
jgi:hypothetical protein